jgi:hypothetical protein
MNLHEIMSRNESKMNKKRKQLVSATVFNTPELSFLQNYFRRIFILNI